MRSFFSLFLLLAVLMALALVLIPTAPVQAHGYGAGTGPGVTPTQVLVQQDQFGNQFRVSVLSNGQVITEPLNGLFVGQSGFARVGNTVILRSGVFNPFVPIRFRNSVLIVR